MALSRRQLTILRPCQVFTPSPGRSFCGECREHVHDLSAMREREAERFLAAHADEPLCIAYRLRADGTVIFRAPARPIATAVLALGLAACTGHASELEAPGEGCIGPDGYVTDCPIEGTRESVRIPDAIDPRDGALASIHGVDEPSDEVLDAVLAEILDEETRDASEALDPDDPRTSAAYQRWQQERSDARASELPPVEQLGKIESWCEILVGRRVGPEPPQKAALRHRKEARCVERLERRQQRRQRTHASGDDEG